MAATASPSAISRLLAREGRAMSRAAGQPGLVVRRASRSVVEVIAVGMVPGDGWYEIERAMIPLTAAGYTCRRRGDSAVEVWR
jgi:hypothetical protein